LRNFARISSHLSHLPEIFIVVSLKHSDRASAKKKKEKKGKRETERRKKWTYYDRTVGRAELKNY